MKQSYHVMPQRSGYVVGIDIKRSIGFGSLALNPMDAPEFLPQGSHRNLGPGSTRETLVSGTDVFRGGWPV